MSHAKFCKCGRSTDGVGACPTCGQFPSFSKCEEVNLHRRGLNYAGDGVVCAGRTQAERV